MEVVEVNRCERWTSGRSTHRHESIVRVSDHWGQMGLKIIHFLFAHCNKIVVQYPAYEFKMQLLK